MMGLENGKEVAMPRSPKQKLKILYLAQYLLERTDEDHPASLEQLREHLAANDIRAERKSLYDDLEALRLFGMEIAMTRTRPGGYYVLSREFQLPELKLLVDSVQASQFITEKKTLQLIKKLEKLCSIYEAQRIRRQVYVSGRIKNMNESIYYGVDAIHNGIAADKMISFLYFEYNVQKEKVYRHGGKRYRISPFALMWDNENYYMIGFDAQEGQIRHYRVDRMEEIRALSEDRKGHEEFKSHDMSLYTRRNFSMYGGEECLVTIGFENKLIGVVMDRFGKDAAVSKVDGEHFSITAPVVVSPQFYGWLFGLDGECRILEPPSVAEGMRQHLMKKLEEFS